MGRKLSLMTRYMYFVNLNKKNLKYPMTKIVKIMMVKFLFSLEINDMNFISVFLLFII